ncbi:Reverse_transcriptase/endonuclease [Hexamita inflata]|uniref:Putative n=1 Tax=Hexamita inflata TaxID=28002 RepID=A0AA86NNE2_9EUKA|nr:Reverse transcriptase/endonuclease [Hexamita inflata]
MLAEAMEEILESDLPTKDLLDVMLLSKDDGGLDLITPGAYFDLMIQNRDMAFQDPTKVNKETRDFFSKNRHEFINSKQYPTNVKSEVKLGHCLDNFYQITNKGFQYLVDMRFNKKQKYVSLDTKCDLCNCKNDIYHELNCKKLQRNHILTHDYFVRQLADKMIDANKVREVKEVSKNNNNRTDQKHKADISFIKDGKQQFFDIGISWDTERYFAVKQKHYQTETVNGQPITCTPIIIGKDTTVHPESLAALRQVGIEDSWLYQQVGILMSNYREQTDYVFRKKTRKAQDQPTELNIQEIEEIDRTFGCGNEIQQSIYYILYTGRFLTDFQTTIIYKNTNFRNIYAIQINFQKCYKIFKCIFLLTVVSEPTLILTNVYVIIALENQITVFMLIITYSINSAVHFFFTSSFK